MHNPCKDLQELSEQRITTVIKGTVDLRRNERILQNKPTELIFLPKNNQGDTTKSLYRGFKSAEKLKAVLRNAREIRTMSLALTLISPRLKTRSECRMSDMSDSGSQGSEYGYSALQEAVISRDLEYMDFLLRAGCDLEQRDENGFTALHVATLEKAVEPVDRLINAGSNVESLTKEGMSSIHIAVEIPDNDKVLVRLAASGFINIRNKVGRTALHLAARGGNLEYLKILLDEGCDRDIKDKFGMKAVDAARARNNEECVRLLLSYVPQKRHLRTFHEDKKNSLEKRLGSSSKRIPNGSSELSERKTLKTRGNDVKQERVLDDEKTRNDTCSFALPKILVWEYNQEILIEKAKVLVEEERRVTQLNIGTASDKQAINVVSLAKEKESCGNNVEKIDSELSKHFNAVNKTEEKDAIGNAGETNGISTTKLWNERTKNIASSKQLDVRKIIENGIPETAPLSSDMLKKSSENRHLYMSEHFIVTESSCNFKDFVKNASVMTLPSIKTSENISDKKYIVSALPTTLASGELLTLFTLRDLKSNRSQKVRDDHEELGRCKKECLVILKLISVSLIRVKLKEEDIFPSGMLNGADANGWLTNEFGTASNGLESMKVISQVLKGLRMSINGATCTIKRRALECDKQKNGEKRRLQYDMKKDEDLLSLFVKACCTIKTQPSGAYATLQEFCNKIALKDNAEIQHLIKQILKICWSKCNVRSEVKSIDCESCLASLDYVVRCDKCPVHFVSDVLHSIMMTQREYMNQALKSRAGFLEFALSRTISCEEKIWDEERIAEIFLLFCGILENQVLTLCRLVDVLLGQVLSRPDINEMVLSSFILVRMGLLKSEFRIEVIENLKGALNALKHAFAQDYFPKSLAGLFVSFLAKSTPRFSRLRDLHNQTLKSALLKEILPQLNDQDADVLGKGLKRICDVLAHGNCWETADHCCKALFIRTLESTKCRESEIGQSILAYFGLIKSEEKLETIKDIGSGLKLLQRVASGNHIPRSIALMLGIFLIKERKRLESYKDDLQSLIDILYMHTKE